jgi:hypothetical protein
MIILSVFLSLIIFFSFTHTAKAIIVIVPVILIPIVHFLVWIIGALTTPVLALSTLYFKIKKKSPIKGFLFGLGILILLSLLIVLIFKLINPARPIFNSKF